MLSTKCPPSNVPVIIGVGGGMLSTKCPPSNVPVIIGVGMAEVCSLPSALLVMSLL